MTRKMEYQALQRELEVLPENLQYTVNRALSRQKALQSKRRLYGIPAGGLAISFTAFILLVNLSVPFARACGTIPLVRELAKAVAWSPSLSAAVENAYVQPIGQSRTEHGVTATIEYVIVDQKQLNIFFTLKGDYENLSADMPQFIPPQQCLSISGTDYRQPPGTLLHYTLDYVDGNVPDHLTMTFGVTTDTHEDCAPVPDHNYQDDLLFPREPEDPDYLAEFTFELSFDPQFTQKGEVLAVNQTFCLDGQILTITEAELYPTHMRLNVEEAADNVRRLKGLEFYLENENGEQFFPVSKGILSSGTLDAPWITSYRLESPFFAQSRRLTLHVTSARWQTQEARRIRVDLTEKTADPLPEGVEFLGAVRREGGWVVSFASPRKADGGLYDRFASHFWDEAGEEHEILSHSMTIGVEDPKTGERSREEEMFTETLPLAGMEGNIAYLEAHFNLETIFEPTISVTIK